MFNIWRNVKWQQVTDFGHESPELYNTITQQLQEICGVLTLFIFRHIPTECLLKSTAHVLPSAYMYMYIITLINNNMYMYIIIQDPLNDFLEFLYCKILCQITKSLQFCLKPLFMIIYMHFSMHLRHTQALPTGKKE